MTLAATPSGLGAYNYVNTIIGFVVFVALIVLSYFVLRWLSRRAMGGSQHMRVIERLMLSRDNAVLIVQVGQRFLALSSTKDGVRLLCELSSRDIPDLSERSDPASLPQSDTKEENSTVWKRFSHNMRVHMGLLPKGTPFARPPEPRQEPQPEPFPSPSPFAMALLRAQADSDREGLMNLLNTSPDPISAPDEKDGKSDSNSVQDYNTAIENLKQQNDKVDELFDKISKRSDRYTKKE